MVLSKNQDKKIHQDLLRVKEGKEFMNAVNKNESTDGEDETPNARKKASWTKDSPVTRSHLTKNIFEERRY